MESLETKSLSNKELVYAEEYLFSLNKTSAALKCKCPKSSAKEQGYQIYNRPHVKAYIEAKLLERTVTADETVKIISDTAKGNLMDYYVPVKVRKTDLIKVGLSDIIKSKREYIIREEEFCDRVGLTEDEYDKFQASLQMERHQIIRLEIELERNPKAYRIIETEAYLTDELQLDIKLLAADKERGRVKKIKYGRDGLEVEMYSALEASKEMAKIHGKYEKDNEQSKAIIQINIDSTDAKLGE